MKPQIILVLGMHRSGTSALAGVLNHLGVEIPGPLMKPAAENNEKGFFESEKLWAFHEELLKEAGSAWDDLLPISAEYLSSPAMSARGDQLTELLAEEYATRPLTAVKDPRMCRLMPLWLDAIEMAGLEPLVVLPLRNPLEVAGSLRRRDGFPESKSQLLWLTHVLLADRSTRGLKRVFVTYEQLLEDWPATLVAIRDGLRLSLPRDLSGAAADVNSFLEIGLRHNVAPPDLAQAEGVLPEVRETWEALIRLANNDQTGVFATLDRVASRLSTATDVFGPYLGWAQSTQQHSAIQVHHMAGELQQVRTELARARERVCELETSAVSLEEGASTSNADGGPVTGGGSLVRRIIRAAAREVRGH